VNRRSLIARWVLFKLRPWGFAGNLVISTAVSGLGPPLNKPETVNYYFEGRILLYPGLSCNTTSLALYSLAVQQSRFYGANVC